MTAAQLVDILIKIPANKRKDYQVELITGAKIEDAQVQRDSKKVVLV